MFEKIKIRNRIKIEKRPAVEFYENNCPLSSVYEKILSTEEEATEHGLNHILWHLFNHKIVCSYCNGAVNYWNENPKIVLTLRSITIYKDVPAGAKDLRIVLLKGWLAHITYSDIEKQCPNCGLILSLKSGHWGLNTPTYGSSTTDLLIESGGGYSVVRRTLESSKYGDAFL